VDGSTPLVGAIAGDMVGSLYEVRSIKTKEFPLFSRRSRFTDDSVLTIAIADALLSDGGFAVSLKRWGRRYPDAGYGGSFHRWLLSDDNEPYNSWGNGSAMRVSAVGYACDSVASVLQQAEQTAVVTHNHPEGVKGAQAVALSVFLGRSGADKQQIKNEMTTRFNYDLDRLLDHIRPRYQFDVSCQGSVPESLIAFIESVDYEDAIRNAVSLGGDSDTMACIAGAIAQPYYGGVPQWIVDAVEERLTHDLLEVVNRFDDVYGPGTH
jgi:ADP-ribosylglycohydrolase